MAVPDSAKLEEKIRMYRDSLLLALDNKVKYQKLLTQQYREELNVLLRKRLDDERYKLERCRLILEENRPEKILDKGYAILETAEGQVVTSITCVKEGQRFRLRMKDGTVMFLAGKVWEEGVDNDL